MYGLRGCGGRTDKPTHYRTIHRIVLPISFALRACFLETRSQVRVLFNYKIKKAVKRLLSLFGCGGRTDKPTHYRTIHRIVLPISFALRACFLETRSQVRVLFNYKIKKAVKRLLSLFGCGGRTRTCDLRVMRRLIIVLNDVIKCYKIPKILHG